MLLALVVTMLVLLPPHSDHPAFQRVNDVSTFFIKGISVTATMESLYRFISFAKDCAHSTQQIFILRGGLTSLSLTPWHFTLSGGGSLWFCILFPHF